MKVNLDGQVALVTGAGRGIGAAIAHGLAANGARVVYSDVDLESAQASAAQSPGSLALQMDVTNEQQIEAGIQRIEREFGRLDILINNAGVNSGLEHRVNIDQFSVAEWDRIFSVDMRGLFLVTRMASRVMIRQKYGRIVNIASVLGVVPARLQCAFTAAKAGVVNLTRTMAIELATSGILVNCVAPGSVGNALFYAKDSPQAEKARRLLSHVPLGRPGTYEEIADSVLYFAARESSYVTGQTLCVDGGWSAGGFFRDF